jgi:hypothetical protein
MAYVTLDRTADNRFMVRVFRGLRGDTVKTFHTHAHAEAFALRAMGHGILLDQSMMVKAVRINASEQGRA